MTDVAKSLIKLKNMSKEETDKLLPDGLILLGYRGSIAHGTYVPQSDLNSIDDKDIMGVFVSPLNYYLGFKKKEHHETFIKEWDAVSYDIRKFVGLLLKCNPNVLSLLWLHDRHYIYKSDMGEALINNRHLFISKKAYHSFNGYAWGQFKRMTHYKFEGYMGEKRKALVDKFGYDTKNAAHLIRLLEMGIEFLLEGTLYVERENAQKIIAIKNGTLTLDEVKAEANRLFNLAQEAYLKSNLPDEPDYRGAEELVIELIKYATGLGGSVGIEDLRVGRAVNHNG